MMSNKLSKRKNMVSNKVTKMNKYMAIKKIPYKQYSFLKFHDSGFVSNLLTQEVSSPLALLTHSFNSLPKRVLQETKLPGSSTIATTRVQKESKNYQEPKVSKIIKSQKYNHESLIFNSTCHFTKAFFPK